MQPTAGLYRIARMDAKQSHDRDNDDVATPGIKGKLSRNKATEERIQRVGPAGQCFQPVRKIL